MIRNMHLIHIPISWMKITPIYKRQSRSAWKAWTYVILITLIVCSLLNHGGCNNSSSTPNGSFQPGKWKEAKGEFAENRKPMVNSLVSSHKLEGLSREDVIDLLGEPDAHNRYPGGNDLNYSLGAESGYFSIDTEWLTIFFRDGQVDEVAVTTD